MYMYMYLFGHVEAKMHGDVSLLLGGMHAFTGGTTSWPSTVKVVFSSIDDAWVADCSIIESLLTYNIGPSVFVSGTLGLFCFRCVGCKQNVE